METLKEYKETIDVWGKEREVTITIFVDDDQGDYAEFIDDTDCSQEQRSEYFRQFRAGELSIQTIFVEVKCDLFLGTDCIGGVFVENAYGPNYVNEVYQYAKDYDLIKNATNAYMENAKKYHDLFKGS